MSNPRKVQNVADTYLDIYEDCEVEVYLPHRVAPVFTKTDCSFSGHFDMYRMEANKWGTKKSIDRLYIAVTPNITEEIEDMWKKMDVCQRFGRYVVSELDDMSIHVFIKTKCGKYFKFIGSLIQSYVDGVASFSVSMWMQRQ